MERYIKPIGGEFWFDFKIFNRQFDNFKESNGIFLSGGQSALRFILKELKIKSDEYILMPSYLCPTILYSFKNIKFDFYEVRKDLSINIDNLSYMIKKHKTKGVYFIDYFGFYHKNETLRYLISLKEKGIAIIEDSAQSLWFKEHNFIGDYVFNSYRKFLPLDGSLVLFNNLNSYRSNEFSEIRDEYYTYMNNGRMSKTAYINFKLGNEEEYLEFFRKAEEEYYKRNSIYAMNEESKKLLSFVDVGYIKNKRKENYEYLYNNLGSIEKLFKAYDVEKTDIIPLCMPVNLVNKINICNDIDEIYNFRNKLRSKLMKDSIYCPVHWNILKEQWAVNYKESVFLSSAILSIPIDERYDLSDMDRIINALNKSMEETI